MERVVVVAAERAVGAALVSLLTELGVPRITLAVASEQAKSLLEPGVDVVFLFASLPERLAFALVREARASSPMPRLVVVSESAHPDLFELARAGVQEHLPWPAKLEHVQRCLELPPPSSVLAEGARFLVGRTGIRKAQADLRRLMLQQALVAASGSRRAAARLLGVTRAAVQHMLKEGTPAKPGQAEQGSSPPPPRRPSGIVPVSGAVESAPPSSKAGRSA
jgi:DNA-binding NtrC family response regulator